MKAYIFAASAVVLLWSAPAFAMDDMKCDDASMAKMQSDMDAMTDPAMTEQMGMAKKDMEMAKTAMKDGKMDDCTMHLNEANKKMMKKN